MNSNYNKSRVLEENMIPWDGAPLEARRVAQELTEGPDGKAIGISVHPISGRVFVIQLLPDPLIARVVWEEEGQCEQCNGTIDDMALGDYRCQGGLPDFAASTDF